jgi:hypothetical protein
MRIGLQPNPLGEFAGQLQFEQRTGHTRIEQFELSAANIPARNALKLQPNMRYHSVTQTCERPTAARFPQSPRESCLGGSGFTPTVWEEPHGLHLDDTGQAADQRV